MPTSMARRASSRVIAGPVDMSAYQGAPSRQQAGGAAVLEVAAGRRGDADVDDADLGPELVGEGVHNRAPGQEVAPPSGR